MSSETKTRIKSAIVMLAIVFAAIFGGPQSFAVFLVVLGALCMHEWMSMTLRGFKQTKLGLICYWGLAFLPPLVFACLWSEALEAVLLLVILFPIALLFGAKADRSFKDWAVYTFGFIYIFAPMIAFSFIYIWAGPIGLIGLIVLVAATDIGAYVFGRQFGGPKLWPKVSPNKTWSGALGGVFCTLIIASILIAFDSKNLLPALAAALLVSISSQLGDLFESWVKRRNGVKDSSNLIPGHGGVLDRVDGLLFASVVLVATVLIIATLSASRGYMY